jgi:dolichol kinase
MILGIIMGLFILYFRKRYVLAVITGLLSAGLVIRLLLLKGYSFKPVEYFLNKFERPMEVGRGAMNFFIGTLIALLFPFPREYTAISVIVLGVSDGIATIMGLGSNHKIYANKSFEGTSAFFTSSFLLIYLNTTLFQAIFVSIILTILELFAPVDDNLIIPPACSLLLSLTTW